MAVGASQPTVVATKDGRIGMKNQMQVKKTSAYYSYDWVFMCKFFQLHAVFLTLSKNK